MYTNLDDGMNKGNELSEWRSQRKKNDFLMHSRR